MKVATPPTDGRTPGRARPASLVAVCLLLVCLVWAIFGQTRNHDFINFDDNVYVSENPHVTGGLTRGSIPWAFRTFQACNWHPLVWLSHELDGELYGTRPRGHHLTNVVLHSLTAIGLFLALIQLTSAFWRSAAVAAFWAAHPQRVESVAWIAERKDVLSGLFFVLTLAAYAQYARRPFSTTRYIILLVLFALGLMAKPMLVTLPFVLLLLDYWPLGRWGCPAQSRQASPFGLPRMWVEKVPFLLLAAASCVVTVVAQRQGQALSSLALVPWSERAANALESIFAYVGQMLWPGRLALLYPHPQGAVTFGGGLAAALGLLAITWSVFAVRRRQPWLLTGWLWHLGMLVPVLGLVQVGLQARADRYTYLPQIGLWMALVWSVAAFAAKSQRRRVCTILASLAALSVLTVLAHCQTATWRNSGTVWTHALACGYESNLAHNDLAEWLVARGDNDAAFEHYEKALRLRAPWAGTLNNYGVLLAWRGRLGEAAKCFEWAARVDPKYPGVGANLRNTRALHEAATRSDAAWQKAQSNLQDAATLGVVAQGLYRVRLYPQAVAAYDQALKLQPDFVIALNNLAWLLATCPDPAVRNGSRALELVSRARQLSSEDDVSLPSTRAAALAECGRIPEAVAVAEHGRAMARAKADGNAAEGFERQLAAFAAGRAYREVPSLPTL